MKKRFHQMELFIKYPHEVQREVLKSLLTRAQDTEFGKKHRFKSITRQDDFCKQVPVSTYEKFFPYIERVMKGEQNVTWISDIHWFSKSSGTTNSKSKFIPVSAESLEDCHFKAGKDLLSVYVNNHPETKLFSGKGLMMGGTLYSNPHRNDSQIGDVSAVMMQNLPLWVEYMRVPDLTIALMDNWEEKLDRMIKSTVHEDISSVSGVPTWTLVLFRKILEFTGKNHIQEVWPNLELLVHGGVDFKPYKQPFQNIISSPDMNFLETYNASEGFFGLQNEHGKDDMLLMLDYGIYYEFIPMQEIENENPKTVTLDKVNCQENYAMVISTNAGLWRYLIGDTIRFTSLSPYKIKLTGRTKNFINAFGEELIVENAETAICNACLKTGAIVRDFTAAPLYFGDKTNGAHEWLIEFEVPPGDIDFFTYLLDDSLKQQNSDYETKRFKDIALKLPVLQILKNGVFNEWLKRGNKLGGQNKIPRLCNDRRFVEEILEIQKNIL